MKQMKYISMDKIYLEVKVSSGCECVPNGERPPARADSGTGMCIKFYSDTVICGINRDI